MSSVKANPNIPQVANPVADIGALATVAQQLKQGIDSLAGVRGDVLNRAVTYNDLVALGILNKAQATAGSTFAGATSALSTETTARIAADSALDAQIKDETKRATAVEAALTTVVTAEVARAESAEAALAASIAAKPSVYLLPLVNGDLPVGIMTDPHGQCIGVPL